MLPRTLLTRLFLLLALLMAISAIAWASIFSLAEQEPRARQVAQLLTSIANITRSALVAAAPERRKELLIELSRQEGIRIDVAEAGETFGDLPDEPFLHKVLEYLHYSLGPQTELQLQKNGEEALFLKVMIEGDDYWIVLPRERFNQSRSFQWLGWGLLAAALALLAAGWFVSRLTRPLRRLAVAARFIGAGEHPPPIPAEGPDEIATVTKAFNQMNADLAQLEQDRALILAGISHDLRTPLTRLRIGIEMTPTDAVLKDGMVADIEDIDRTIGQFLDFSRTDDGEQAETTDLGQLLNEIATQFRRHDVDVSVDIASPCHAKAKRNSLRRAITNLVDNALRHAGKHSRIELGLSLDDALARISVGDRGPGIPEAEMERLRRPFTRLESARSSSVGAGLGLAIVDRIARLHGGTFTLSNRQPNGLLATLSIPAFRA